MSRGTGAKLCADSSPQIAAPGHFTRRSRFGPSGPFGQTVTVSSVAGAEELPGLSSPSSSLPQPTSRTNPAMTIARRSMPPFYVERGHVVTDLSGGERGRLRLQREVEHLADRHDRVERHRLADVLGDVGEVASVALRQDHVGEPGRVGGEHLLLEPADR